MKAILVCLLLIYLIHQGAGEPPKYTTKYDGINLDDILANDRLLTGYVTCLLDAGPCTPDGKELKKNLPDAIDNDCAKCTDKQRQGADEVMHYIIDHRPDDWKKLEEKYKSDGTYKKKYLESKQSTTNTNRDDSDNANNKSREKKE